MELENVGCEKAGIEEVGVALFELDARASSELPKWKPIQQAHHDSHPREGSSLGFHPLFIKD